MKLWSGIRKLFSGSQQAPPGLDRLESSLGYHFQDKELLLLGLTHRSALRSGPSDQESYERIEFLGDSVLGLVIADQLYCRCPELTEGDLTKVKALLVNETTLARVAIDIGLTDHIRLSSDEERSGGRQRSSIASDALEAVIGTVYLDGGFEAARRVVLATVYARKADIMADDSQKNYKGDLLEFVQGEGGAVPVYDVVSTEGPDHEKTFHVAVTIDAHELGRGVGSSKKEAEQKAARMALERLTDHDASS